MQRNEAHLNLFDTLRGMAVLGIFLAHCRGEAYGWDLDPSHAQTLDARITLVLMIGAISVPIFFAISGFCIHLAHSRTTRKDWPIFFTRRFLRIYPPYFIAAAILCVVFRAHWLSTGEVIDHGQVYAHLLFIQNLWERTLYGINGSFWSLAVEVQLYLLYPILFLLGRRIGWTRMLIITAVVEGSLRSWQSACLALNHAPPPTCLITSPFAYWFSWAVGAAVAEAFLRGEPLPFARVPLWVFPVMTVVTAGIDFLQPFFFPLTSLATVVIINRSLTAPENLPASRVSWLTRYLRYVGTISYSMCLIHQPFVYAIADRLHHTRIAGSPPLVLAITVLFWFPILFLARCFYRVVEQPSIALGKSVVRRWSHGATSKAA